MSAGAPMLEKEKEKDEIQDTEITLSTGKLLGIFFALAVVCGVFFTMGYLLGKSTSAGGRTEIVGAAPTGGSMAGKPSAANKPQEATTPAASGGDTKSGKNPDASANGPSSATKTPDQPAQPAGTEVKNGAGGSFMVQVAAVSKAEDAETLKNELQKKQYPVFVANSSGDPLFHVQVGPFSERKDAEAMRTRLVGDGYNAIVK